MCVRLSISDGVTDGDADHSHSCLLTCWECCRLSCACIRCLPPTVPPSLHFVSPALALDRCHVRRAWLALLHPRVRWIYQSSRSLHLVLQHADDGEPVPGPSPLADPIRNHNLYQYQNMSVF